MITDRETIRKAAAVSEMLMELGEEKADPGLSVPYDDFAYGEALVLWESDSYDPLTYFSTDDPTLLFHRKDLQAKFGLEILTFKEATERKKATGIASLFQSAPVKTPNTELN